MTRDAVAKLERKYMQLTTTHTRSHMRTATAAQDKNMNAHADSKQSSD